MAKGTAKVVQFTMMVEITEDSAHPAEWDWHAVMENTPGVAGFSLLHTENRPYACMEDDPDHNTKH